MAGDPDYQPMKTELDALAAAMATLETATEAVTDAVDLARALTLTQRWEEGSNLVNGYDSTNRAAGSYHTLVSVTGKGYLQEWSVGSVDTMFGMRMIVDGTVIQTISGGAGIHSVLGFWELAKMTDKENSWAKIQQTDAGNTDYSMRLTSSISFNTSLSLQVRTWTGAGANIHSTWTYFAR